MIPKHYVINKGNVFLSRLQTFTISGNLLMIYFNFKKNTYSASELMKYYEKCYYDDIYIFYNNLYKKGYNFKKIIYKFRRYLESYGHGEIDILKCSESKVKLKVKSIFLTKKQNLIFNENNFKFGEIYEVFFINLFKNLIEVHTKKKCEVVTDLNSDNYEFEILITDEDFEYVTDKEYEISKYNFFTREVSNIINKCQINYNLGQLSFAKVKIVLFPYFTFLNCLEKHYCEKHNNYFLRLGYLNGINRTKIKQKLVGKTGLSVFLKVMNLYEISGFGKFNYDIKDVKKASLKFDFLKKAEKYYDKKLINLFFRFICEHYRGTYNESFGINSKIKYGDGYNFEIIEIDEKEIFSKEDKFILENISYEKSLVQR